MVSGVQMQDRACILACVDIYKHISVCSGRLWFSHFHQHLKKYCLKDLIFSDYEMRWHPWCACPRGSSWKVLLCIGRLSLAVRSLEQIITVIPKQKLSTAYFQMCSPWVVWQKKSVVQQYWELCLFWQPAGPGCAGGLPSWASLTVCPLCAAFSFLYPSWFLCYEGLHFNASIFLKGMGYLRCSLPIAVAQGMAQARLAVKALLLWRYFHLCIKDWSVMGSSKRAWVIAGYFTWWNLCKAQTRGSSVEGRPGRTSEQILEKYKVPMLDPLFCFSIFHQHRFDNWWLHLQLMRFCTSVCESCSGPGPVWIFSPLAIRSGSGSVTGLSLGAHHK